MTAAPLSKKPEDNTGEQQGTIVQHQQPQTAGQVLVINPSVTGQVFYIATFLCPIMPTSPDNYAIQEYRIIIRRCWMMVIEL